MRLRFVPVALGLLATLGTTAATTNELSDAQIQGRQLVQQLVEQQPATNFVQTGTMKIRAKGIRTEIPIQFQIVAPEANSAGWLSVYQIIATNHPLRLVITHSAGQPNGYRLIENGVQKDLTGAGAMIPFNGSDFWLADLGLEFFHWPEQRLLKKEVKRSRGCSVLQSTNPDSSTNGYSRVVSWIDSESGGIVQAWAYDSNNRLFKEFYPKDFKKINGQWQVAEMEIDNDRTGSRTQLEFDLKKP